MKRLAGALLPLGLAAAAMAGIALVQEPLSADARTVKQREDVILLPPPAELRAMTLGYRAAAADLLWAKLIVEHGLHVQEKRPFPDVVRYLDGILAVEPDFALLYEFVDTLVLYAPEGNTADNARVVRAYLERGTRERPFDPKMWLHYGQYMAFLAQSFLEDEQEIDAWRMEGALALARAVELGSDPDRSLSASTILSKAGESKAAIEHLQRAYALADDPETRRQISAKLRHLEATSEAEVAVDAVEREWRASYPFFSRDLMLLVGPRRKPAACAGPSSYDRKRCPRNWSAFIDQRR
jgi:hypothetical protein